MRATPNGRSRSCATGRMPPAVADRTRKTARWRPVARGLHVVSDRSAGYARNHAPRRRKGLSDGARPRHARPALRHRRALRVRAPAALEERVAEEDRIPPEIVA